MKKLTLHLTAGILLLTCFLYSNPLPVWSDIVVSESAMPSKGNDFTVKAYEFMQSGEYKNFVVHEGVAGKTAFLEGGVMVVENRSYFTPEYIPTNVEELSKYDVVRVYSLFNVVYYIEKIDQDIRSILSDSVIPMPMETVQATILTCVYNKNILDMETFTLYVYGKQELADQFKFYAGQPIGSSVLESITSGLSLPETPPNVMVVSHEIENIDEVVSYCRDHNVLSISDQPRFLLNGITVGVGTFSGVLKLLLNTQGVNGGTEYWSSESIFYKKI